MTAKLIEAMASAAAGGQTPRPPGHVQVGNPAKCGLSLPKVQRKTCRNHIQMLLTQGLGLFFNYYFVFDGGLERNG